MLFKLAVLLAVSAAAYAAQLTLINNSGTQPVFVQIAGTESVDPFVLQPMAKTVVDFGNTWNGRVWARTDCLSVAECNVAGSIPTSYAELNIGVNGLTFYDVSLLNGFNVKNSIEPVGGTGEGDFSCQKSQCAYPILDDCPSELKVYNNNNVYTSCSSADDASFFKERCPNAVVSAFDDLESTYTCDTTDYILSFL